MKYISFVFCIIFSMLLISCNNAKESSTISVIFSKDGHYIYEVSKPPKWCKLQIYDTHSNHVTTIKDSQNCPELWDMFAIKDDIVWQISTHDLHSPLRARIYKSGNLHKEYESIYDAIENEYKFLVHGDGTALSIGGYLCVFDNKIWVVGGPNEKKIEEFYSTFDGAKWQSYPIKEKRRLYKITAIPEGVFLMTVAENIPPSNIGYRDDLRVMHLQSEKESNLDLPEYGSNSGEFINNFAYCSMMTQTGDLKYDVVWRRLNLLNGEIRQYEKKNLKCYFDSIENAERIWVISAEGIYIINFGHEGIETQRVMSTQNCTKTREVRLINMPGEIKYFFYNGKYFEEKNGKTKEVGRFDSFIECYRNIGKKIGKIDN